MIHQVWQLLGLMRALRMGPEALESLQLRRFRRVFRHAYRRVPYYRALYESAGLTPDDIRTLDDLRHVPVSSKEGMRAAGESALTIGAAHRPALLSTRTSGSTGEPFTVYLSPFEMRLREWVQFRSLLQIGFSPRDRLAVLGPSREHRLRFHQKIGFFWSENISPLSPAGEQLRRLKEIQPTVLWIYPTLLEALLAARGSELTHGIRPRLCIMSSEVLDESLRARVLSWWPGVQVFDFYGTHEVGRIAWECPTHAGLHINADQVLVECMEEEGMVGHGRAGPVAVTALNAFTMPFIRYRLGDVCSFLEGKCGCGSSFPLISAPLGREDDLIRLPGGKVVAPVAINFVLRPREWIGRFRVIQDEIDHLSVQIVPLGNVPSGGLEEVRSGLCALLDAPVHLDVRMVDSLDEAPRLKAVESRLSHAGGRRGT